MGLVAQCSLLFSGLQQHETLQTAQMADRKRGGGVVAGGGEGGGVAEVNARLCPIVKGNGANLMLLSS